MKQIYDPIEFISKIEILTFAVIGSFITYKLLNSIYENIYEPSIDNIIYNDISEEYYLKIGSHYIQFGLLFKEIIKWLILVIIIMLIYNIFSK